MSIVTIPNASTPRIAFTPTLTFGGANTGMVLGVHSGFYIEIGGLVWFMANLVLTTKGSSVGGAAVGGLPFVSAAADFQPISTYADTLSSVAGQIAALIVPGSSAIALYQLGTGTAGQLTNANFNNSTTLYVSGVYPIR